MPKRDAPDGHFGGPDRLYLARIRVSTRVAAVVVLLCAFSFRVEAEPTRDSRTRTILLIDAAGDPMSMRMTAELGALGFDVRAIQPSPATTTADSEIELLSRSIAALATIGIDRASGVVRVWTVNLASGEIVLRAVVAIEQDPAVVALRAVEAVRTSLNDVEAPSAPYVGTAEASIVHAADRPTPLVPSHGPASLDVSLGPALAGSGGSSGVSWQALVSLHWLWRPRWGMEIVAVAPMGGVRWMQNEGTASLTFGLLAAGAHWRPLARQWCTLDFGGGMGAAIVHSEGSPNSGFFGRKRDTLVATPFVRMGYAVYVGWSLWLRADVVGAVAIPRPVFAFADRLAGAWGQPLVFGSLGVEIVLR